MVWGWGGGICGGSRPGVGSGRLGDRGRCEVWGRSGGGEGGFCGVGGGLRVGVWAQAGAWATGKEASGPQGKVSDTPGAYGWHGGQRSVWSLVAGQT